MSVYGLTLHHKHYSDPDARPYLFLLSLLLMRKSLQKTLKPSAVVHKHG